MIFGVLGITILALGCNALRVPVDPPSTNTASGQEDLASRAGLADLASRRPSAPSKPTIPLVPKGKVSKGPVVFVTVKEPDVTPRTGDLIRRNEIIYGPHSYKDDRIQSRSDFSGVKPIWERPIDKPDVVKFWVKGPPQARKPNSGPKPTGNQPSSKPSRPSSGGRPPRPIPSQPPFPDGRQQPSNGRSSSGPSSCERRCSTSHDYQPVCGSDGVEYSNMDKLKCAQNCGKRVLLGNIGKCVKPFVGGRGSPRD